MMSLVVLLTLAFAIGRIIKTIGTGKFLASLVSGQISGNYCAAIVFIWVRSCHSRQVQAGELFLS